MPADACEAPAHCRVTGLLAPEIAFEVSLPSQWNGRFYMIGNGGLAGGSVDNAGRAAQRNEALKLGFAFAQTNTGHDSRKEPGGTFVLSNPEKAIDYAYRAVHLTAATAKAIVKDYYGKADFSLVLELLLQRRAAGRASRRSGSPRTSTAWWPMRPGWDQTGFTIGAMWNQKALSAGAGHRGQAGRGRR